MALPANSSPINTSDTISDTIKTTAGYFTDGDGTLEGDSVFTGSLSSTNEKYYFNVNQLVETDSNSETQLSVTFGHIAGSGSDTYGDSDSNANTIRGESQVIYKQLSTILQHENDTSGGFFISSTGTEGVNYSSQVTDDYVYAIIGKRSKFKDRMNKKSWTLALSGSTSNGLTGSILYLTDDSKDQAATATPGGPRYNIVSGSLGNVVKASTLKTYGWFYPERGIMLFSGAELSASMPGGHHYPGAGNMETGLSATVQISGSNGHFHLSGSVGNTDFTGSINAIYSNLFTDGSDGATAQDYGLTIQYNSGSAADSPSEGVCNVTGVNSLIQVITCSEALVLTGGGDSSPAITCSIGLHTTTVTASFATDGNIRKSSSGFAPNLSARGNNQNGLRLVNCMRNMGSDTSLRLRSEEDATEENYFCRINATAYNFSANPTFVSGSKNKIRNTDMWGNPSTFISGVGLYNSAGQLLAIAELSKPLLKNFASEATIKVKLTY